MLCCIHLVEIYLWQELSVDPWQIIYHFGRAIIFICGPHESEGMGFNGV